jgi:hypothetical protein
MKRASRALIGQMICAPLIGVIGALIRDWYQQIITGDLAVDSPFEAHAKIIAGA